MKTGARAFTMKGGAQGFCAMLIAASWVITGCTTIDSMTDKVAGYFSGEEENPAAATPSSNEARADEGTTGEVLETAEVTAEATAEEKEKAAAEAEAALLPAPGATPATVAIRRAPRGNQPRGRIAGKRGIVLLQPSSSTPMIVSETDVPAAIAWAARAIRGEAEEIEASRVEFFVSEPIGRAYLRDIRHGVLVVGEPRDVCSYTSAHAGYENLEEGIADGLVTCSDYLSAVSTLLKQKCRCRLAGIDNRLFVEPRTLRLGDRYPILHMHQQRSGGETIAYYGQVQLAPSFPGTVPVKVFAGDTRRPVCEGLTSTTSERKGELRMTCRIDPDNPETVNGSWRIEGEFLRRPYGEIRMQSKDRLHILLFGIAPQNMAERLEACCTGPSSGIGKGTKSGNAE